MKITIKHQFERILDLAFLNPFSGLETEGLIDTGKMKMKSSVCFASISPLLRLS